MRPMGKESAPQATPQAIVDSLLKGELRPADRTDEKDGYYFLFCYRPDYPMGAPMVIHWTIKEDGTLEEGGAYPARDYAEVVLENDGIDRNLMPDVAVLLSQGIEFTQFRREIT
jgi:hypothetical protein